MHASGRDEWQPLSNRGAFAAAEKFRSILFAADRTWFNFSGMSGEGFMFGIAPSAAMDAARALAPQIQGFAEEIEQSRRIPLPLVEAVAQAGLFRLWVPRALGGEEADPMTLVRVVEEISRADGSVGWCVAIGGGSGVFGGYLPSASAREIYGSVSCCSRLATAKSSTPGTVSGCAGLAAMTLPWRIFLFRPIAHSRSGNHLWSQGRFMRCRR
jgi:hypothetical protein